MASLIPKDGLIFDCATTAPSPCKDYCQVLVTKNEVIYRWWKISLRCDARGTPGEVKDCYKDFLSDYTMQGNIQRVFGKDMLDYVKMLVHGQIDYFPRLPSKLIVRIAKLLELEDISRLAQVSTKFRQVCSSDDLWKEIYLEHNPSAANSLELNTLAEEMGWRKLFFTNRLQMQVQLRRHRTKQLSPDIGQGERHRWSDENANIDGLPERQEFGQGDE